MFSFCLSCIWCWFSTWWWWRRRIESALKPRELRQQTTTTASCKTGLRRRWCIQHTVVDLKERRSKIQPQLNFTTTNNKANFKQINNVRDTLRENTFFVCLHTTQTLKLHRFSILRILIVQFVACISKELCGPHKNLSRFLVCCSFLRKFHTQHTAFIIPAHTLLFGLDICQIIDTCRTVDTLIGGAFRWWECGKCVYVMHGARSHFIIIRFGRAHF